MSKRLYFASALLVTSVTAHADFTAEAFVSYRGAPNAEFAGWDWFTSPVGGSNAPDHIDTSAEASFDLVQLNAGAILTGGNLYSFSGPTRFVLSHSPGAGIVAGMAAGGELPDLARVSLQVSTLGNELEDTSIALEYTDGGGAVHSLPYDHRAELTRYSLSGFGDAVESLFEWDLAAVDDVISDYRLVFASAEAHMSLDAVQVDALWDDGPFTYCAPGQVGCAARIGWTGGASGPAIGSASGGSGGGFFVNATGVPPGAPGLLFYGTSGAKQSPFKGGWRCLRPPFRRTSVALSSSNSGACGGSFQFDFDAYLAAGSDPALGPFSTVHAQFWFVDPTSPKGVGSTDALQFVLQP